MNSHQGEKEEDDLSENLFLPRYLLAVYTATQNLDLEVNTTVTMDATSRVSLKKVVSRILLTIVQKMKPVQARK